ncbi:hypothetical protein R3P38DRAFT_2555109 [Favolaschia claudopus]|uniref:Uncharacterized protein n=1 Tax=Favolaschia claudopus TaxID=2862362 RepID=A0AAW0ADF3_9AGAR
MRDKVFAVRWARLRLPSGQVARSLWKEAHRQLNKLRIARNVKYIHNNREAIAEVQFYFRARIEDETHAYALIDDFSAPDAEFLELSYGTFYICGHGQGEHLFVIPVKDIVSVVAMVPLSIHPRAAELFHDSENSYFLVEKPGLDAIRLAGYMEKDEELDDPL